MAQRLIGKPDEALAAMIAREGSEEAAAEVFRRYHRKIYLWCFGYARDREEALDLTQEIFIRMFRGIDGFAGRSRFSTWVYRIARNHCVTAATRRRAEASRLASAAESEVEDAGWTERMRQRDIAGDLDRLLVRAGEQMPEEELSAFVLHYRDGLSVNEITRTLRCENASGARTLIQNARRKLHRLAAHAESVRD